MSSSDLRRHTSRPRTSVGSATVCASSARVRGGNDVVVTVLVLLPVLVLVVVAVLALVSVGQSSLHLTPAGVEFRNYPQPARVIPLAEVARFEDTVPTGNFPSLRP